MPGASALLGQDPSTTGGADRRYCLVSPCRNEAAHMRRTLDSVVEQTEVPAKWIVVDDGSTDETSEILAEYAERFDWIEVVQRTDRGARSVGGGVIDAFYAGWRTVNPDDFDYVGKLDMDLILPPTYFTKMMDRMEQDPALGTCSGKAFYPDESNPDGDFQGKLISEGIGDDMSVGAAKFYRRDCFEQIGGFVRQVMWDGIDCHRCRMHGWTACSWDDPELRFIHLRPMGSSDRGILTGRLRHGFGQYFMGTSLLYMTASSVYRLNQRPLVVGSLAMWWGYVVSLLQRKARYEDTEFRQYLRSYHWFCLTHGKRRALKEIQRLYPVRAAASKTS